MDSLKTLGFVKHFQSCLFVRRMGRERAKRKRDTEDPITREARLKKNREAARDRRASEPLDQRLERLERNREQAR